MGYIYRQAGATTMSYQIVLLTNCWAVMRTADTLVSILRVESHQQGISGRLSTW